MVDNFIYKCYLNSYLTYDSVLLYQEFLDFDYLKEKYEFYFLDEGKNIENILKQISMANIFNAFNKTNKKKLLVIDGVAIYDKGFSTYLNKILQNGNIKNIAIIIEIYDFNILNYTLKSKCQIFKNNNPIRSHTLKFKNIQQYKKFLYMECQKNIYHSYNKE